MDTQAGEVVDLVQENPVVNGCTISNKLFNDSETSVTVFSLAAYTNISSSSYDNYHLITLEKGDLIVSIDDHQEEIKQGDSLLIPKGASVKISANKDSIYTELSLPKDASFNSVIQTDKFFQLTDLIPYQQGKIVNLDLITGHSFKLALMALDSGTELAEHAAPGNAMIFALDGQGIVNYEGKDKNLTTRTTLKMSNGAHHSVTAKVPYKMALLVMTPSAKH